MTQHVDEIARAIQDAVRKSLLGIFPRQAVEEITRAAMRAVVKQMREPSEGMLKDCWAYGISDVDGKYFLNSALDAYMKEAGIDE